MLTRFLCLANSLKEGGRCLAGIELDMDNRPVFIDGRPKWIRPVCDTEHGEIPIHIAVPFDLLDIIELDILEPRPLGYQSENISFNQKSIQKTGVFNVGELPNLCDHRPAIFGNRGKAVSQESIDDLTHSLVLIKATHFNVFTTTQSDRSHKSQIRISFEYNSIEYDLPITDPVFRYQYAENKNTLMEIDQIYLCVSLGIPWEGWHYKLVAGIIY